MRLLLSVIAITAVIVVIAFLAKVKVPPRRSVDPLGATHASLSLCYYVIFAAEKEEQKPIRELVAAESGTTLYQKFSNIFARYVDKTNYLPLVDGWQWPLIVLFRDHLAPSNIPPRLHSSDLLIWSVGPNGINEYGKGDDFTYPPPDLRPPGPFQTN